MRYVGGTARAPEGGWEATERAEAPKEKQRGHEKESTRYGTAPESSSIPRTRSHRGEPLQVHPTVVISTAGKCAQNILADLWKLGELIDRRFQHVCLAHSVIITARAGHVLSFFNWLPSTKVLKDA